MDLRDKARSNLYLANYRLQSAPNTPGIINNNHPKSPYVSATPASPNISHDHDEYSNAEKGDFHHYPTQYATTRSPTKPLPTFQLQPPPARAPSATPKARQDGFGSPVPAAAVQPGSGNVDRLYRAPGEPSYEDVPIPSAYSRPTAGLDEPPMAHLP